MEALWAPWRMEYILAAGKKEKGCIFCSRLKQNQDRKNLILWRSETVAVFLNRFPYNNGHLMVLPRRHLAEIKELNQKEVKEIHQLTALSLKVLKRALNPDGFNLGLNLGRVAGAGILDHLHWHIVPRWNGDTNFMPVIADTKVMPEHLQTLFLRLRKEFVKESE
jgi:ATP adenylyltransferase